MYRRGLVRIVTSVLRTMLLAALAGGVVGGLLAGLEGAVNGAILAGMFGLTGGVLGLLSYFFRDDSRDEAALRWHEGGGRDE